MGKRIPEVTAYIEGCQPFARPILKHLRELVHEACPEADEAIKWGHPNFVYGGLFANMAGFKAHVAFGLHRGKELMEGKATLGTSSEKAMGSFGRITSLEDLPADRTVKALIKKAKKLHDAAAKAPKASKPKKKIVVEEPDYFVAALKKNAKARKFYESLAPGQKRDYVEWFTEAKREATREKRLATAIEWLSEGKRRHWKYENC